MGKVLNTLQEGFARRGWRLTRIHPKPQLDWVPGVDGYNFEFLPVTQETVLSASLFQVNTSAGHWFVQQHTDGFWYADRIGAHTDGRLDASKAKTAAEVICWLFANQHPDPAADLYHRVLAEGAAVVASLSEENAQKGS